MRWMPRVIAVIIRITRNFITAAKFIINKLFGSKKSKFRKLAIKIKKGVRALYKVLKFVLKPLEKAKKKAGIKGGKKFVRHLLKKLGVKTAAKVLAKFGARMLAAGATAASGVGTIVSAFWTVGNIALLAWDIYEVSQVVGIVDEIMNVISSIPSMVKNITNLSGELSSEEDEKLLIENIKRNINVIPLIEQYANKPMLEKYILGVSSDRGQIKQINKDYKKFLEKTSAIIEDIAKYEPAIEKVIKNADSKEEIVDRYYNLIKSERENIFKVGELSMLLKGSTDASKPLTLIEIWQRIISWIENNIFKVLYSKKIAETLIKINASKIKTVDDNYIFDTTGKLYKSDNINLNDPNLLSLIEKTKVKTISLFEPFLKKKEELVSVLREKTRKLQVISELNYLY